MCFETIMYFKSGEGISKYQNKKFIKQDSLINLFTVSVQIAYLLQFHSDSSADI